MPRRRHCPDCEGDQSLVPIQVIDMFQGGGRAGLMFTAAGAKRSVWTGYSKQQAGFVHGFLCPSCGRVLWYAMTEEEGKAMLAQEAESQS